ncbi:hypothetical protein KF840_18825 [bacterium]|nr:hypothetical protein [bacterium]
MDRTATELLDVLTRRGVRLHVDDAGQLHYRAPRGALDEQTREALARYKAELLAALRAEPITDGTVAAVLLRGTCWGELWLIAGDDVLAEHPDVERSGLPVVRFAELPYLHRLDAEGLRALGLVKRTWPTARVLQ